MLKNVVAGARATSRTSIAVRLALASLAAVSLLSYASSPSLAQATSAPAPVARAPAAPSQALLKAEEVEALVAPIALYPDDLLSVNPTGDRVVSYAQRIVSTPGTKDGLYWPTSTSEPRSPLGAAMAAATVQGYRAGQRAARYHGYNYKILTAQGPTVPGGASGEQATS